MPRVIFYDDEEEEEEEHPLPPQQPIQDTFWGTNVPPLSPPLVPFYEDVRIVLLSDSNQSFILILCMLCSSLLATPLCSPTLRWFIHSPTYECAAPYLIPSHPSV